MTELTRFLLPLGYYLPVPDDLRITSHFHDHESRAFTASRNVQTTVSFIHIPATNGSALAAQVAAQSEAAQQAGLLTSPKSASESDAQLEAVETVLDVTTEKMPLRTHSPEEDPREWHPLSDPIMTGLKAANIAIQNVTNSSERYFPTLSYESLPLLIVTYRAHADAKESVTKDAKWDMPDPHKWRSDGITYLSHSNFTLEQRDDSLEERVFEYFNRNRIDVSHPFKLYRERAAMARGHLRTGRYSECSITLSTAMETMLIALIMHIQWETRWPAVESSSAITEARALFDSLESRSMVREALSKSLGGNWTSPTSAWERWNEKGVELRNRVVHGGHTPSYIETKSATDAHEAMTKFLADRIALKTKLYPRTALKLVGEQSLRKRDRWTKQIASFSRDIAPVEEDWDRSFVQWMENVTHRSA